MKRKEMEETSASVTDRPFLRSQTLKRVKVEVGNIKTKGAPPKLPMKDKKAANTGSSAEDQNASTPTPPPSSQCGLAPSNPQAQSSVLQDIASPQILLSSATRIKSMEDIKASNVLHRTSKKIPAALNIEVLLVSL